MGEVLHYSYVVTNTGNVTLTGVTVGDDQEPVTCDPAVPVDSLAPGATITCSATHVVTQADLDAGSVVNVATGDSEETGPVTDTVSVPGAQTSGLLVVKSADEPSFAAVGEVLHYSYVVTNTGNVTLTGVTVGDDQEPVTCVPPVPVASLAPGATITCSATHVVTQADLDAGSVVNVATADSEQTPPVTDTVSVPGAQTPGLLVEKSATESSFAAVGEVMHYSYVVTNTGNVTLTGVTLVDDQEPVTCDAGGAGRVSLAPGATITCSATHVVTQADLDAGSVVNVATGDSEQTAPKSPTPCRCRRRRPRGCWWRSRRTSPASPRWVRCCTTAMW